MEVEVRGAPEDPENIAASMGAALHRIAAQLASRVASRLTARGAGDATASARPSAAGEVRSPDIAVPEAEQ